MTKLNKLSKLFLFLTIVFGSLWLGSYLIRQLVVYQFFEPEGLALRSYYNQLNLDAVIKTIAPILVSNIILYLFYLVFFLIFLFVSKIKLKEEGWFLITILVIFITAPFELYLLYKDYKIVDQVYFAISTPSLDLIALLKERMQSLSSFALIEIFSYIGIVFLFIFKPLRKTNEN
ncbi:MAG: hypothetical protein GYA14_05655 [Ignavibacteria bacterium]|nr:hypothetical protein [Ignavibacteria bacterium]